MTIDVFDPDGGGGSALALAQGGAREVSYLNVPYGLKRELKYAVCHSACGASGNWTKVIIERIDFNNSLFEGEVTSLAIGPDGRRHITYFDPAQGDLKYATCLSNCTKASNWRTLRLDQSGIVGLHSALDVGQDRVLHVGYYDLTNGNLKYARCAFDCTTPGNWRKLAIATAYDVGRYASIGLEANGRVHLGSYHVTGTALYYSTCSAACTVSWNWTHAVLDGVNSRVGQYGSLAVRNSVLYISYYDQGNGHLRYLRRAPLIAP